MKNREYYINLLKVEQMMSDDNYQYLELYEFSKAEHLLHQGQTLEYLYILVSGRIKSCRTTANGTTVLSAFSNPITVTGEVEFLNHHEVTNDVYALKNTVCFRISVAQYEDILLHDLIFMRYLARTLSNRLYHANHNTAISINYPVENRLASYLISSAQQLIIKDNFVQVAEMIGCSYRQLQRVLNDFCQCGYLCKVKRGNYLITDESALKALGQDLYYI